MKIEMGESLIYSWLRHVKECHIVQANWKISPNWELQNRDKVINLLEYSSKIFHEQLGSMIYKEISLDQFLKQAEVDVLGISFNHEGSNIYAVDVAFHEAGLNYGSRSETVARVVKKCMRTVMCIFGYLGHKEGEIIFASPKIHNAVISEILPFIELSNQVLRDVDLGFRVRIIANDDFEEKIMSPILVASQGVSDTSELFLRSYQMYKMFSSDTYVSKQTRSISLQARKQDNEPELSDAIDKINDSGLEEMKVGKIANIVLRSMLEDGMASDEEIMKMQTTNYSKEVFHLNLPLLVVVTKPYERIRYYKKTLLIKGIEYALCSQWFETPANNDKPWLLKWISEHKVENTRK
ncbi:hypothetical protein [Desulfolutivibrio sulfoxidireducens]|uniref:hypothetical protein n=1 Tax=Desulfolutivibrio sulfoxidireducens TaxID=2773299 RepID=UPI00159EB8D4|nr:hypothetical protein [Desulfolutivibrio sulfoxidireducens]QLA16867.1 hypothetical protein GD605_12600 [Desulfolutivibrio sulfoxidireducens]